MGRIPDETLDEIRRRTDIVKIAERLTQLRRAGRSFIGLCPFHQERTPSFNVNPDLGLFKCFGCGKGGDVIGLVMESQGLDFVEAVRHLAEAAGVPIVTGGPVMPKGEREALFAANDAAADFFKKQLADPAAGKIARDYIERRGLDPNVARQFHLGYAPPGWDNLLRHLRQARHDVDAAERAGLITSNDAGRRYDRFRNRLMFPVRNRAGKIAAFSGRILGDEDEAKYVNSPESAVFHKSDHFFGIDRALESIRKTGRAILCEGNLDVMMLHQFGFSESLAALGTALTDRHVTQLSRLADDVVIIFDGDEAGRRATMRALEVFLPSGKVPKAVALPAGDDPDSFLRREGADAMKQKLDAAVSLIAYVVDRVFGAQPDDHEGRARAAQAMIPILARIGDEMLRDLWVKTVAERAGVREDSLRREARKGRRPRLAPQGATRRADTGEGRADPERSLARLLVTHPKFAARFLDEGVADLFENRAWRDIALSIAHNAAMAQDDADLNLAGIVGAIADERLREDVAGFGLADDGLSDAGAAEAFDDFVAHIKARKARARLADVDALMRQAEAGGDAVKSMALAHERLVLQRLLKDAPFGKDGQTHG